MAKRAKRHWYWAGDHNTHFFDACANQRRKKNFIKKLYNENNEIIEDDIEIALAFREYFTNLFGSSAPSQADIDRITQAIYPTMTKALNSQLLDNYKKEEVYVALK